MVLQHTVGVWIFLYYSSTEYSLSKLSSMPASLPLLHGSITLEEALKSDDNILHQLSYPAKRLEFYVFL
jgi:hypothetical protein